MDFNTILEILSESKQENLFSKIVKDWRENEPHIRWVTKTTQVSKVKKQCQADKDWEKADTVDKMENLIGKYTPKE